MLGLIARPLDTEALSSGGGEALYQTSFPKTNLLNNDFGRVMRTTTAGVNSIHVMGFDLGADPPAVNAVALLWHNLRAGDAIHVRAGSTMPNAAAGTDYSSGALTPVTGTTNRAIDLTDEALNKFLLTLSSPQTWRYWTVHLVVLGTAIPAGYVQASRLLFMNQAMFQIGPQRAEVSAIDLNQRIQLETGEDRSSEDELLIRPVAQLDLAYAKESEMRDVLGQYTLGLGTSRPMFLCSDVSDADGLQDLMVFGRPESIISQQSDTYDVWRFQARVKSIGP